MLVVDRLDALSRVDCVVLLEVLSVVLPLGVADVPEEVRLVVVRLQVVKLVAFKLGMVEVDVLPKDAFQRVRTQPIR
jgi:hypothetical protein